MDTPVQEPDRKAKCTTDQAPRVLSSAVHTDVVFSSTKAYGSMDENPGQETTSREQ